MTKKGFKKLRALICLFVLQFFLSCNQSIPKKLLRHEVLDLHRNSLLAYEKAKLIDTLGKPLSSTIDFHKEVVYEFFINKKGTITQIMEVPILSFEDEIYAIQMRLIPVFKPSYFQQPLACDTIKDALRAAGILDQNIRNGEIDMDISLVDVMNQKLVVSSIEQCGFPTMENIGKLAINSIWIILHHADKHMMAYYYQNLQSAVYEGAISYSNFALTVDRMLMHNNYPQVYGTQYQYGKFYKLRDPENVNRRREAIGMRPFDQWELANVVGLNL